MGDTSKVVLSVSVVTFVLGVFVGYKLKGWRIDYLKRRRERLASKLLETQKEIELLSKAA
jgi:hypothetical protein